MALQSSYPGMTLLHKFGYNADVDAAEDIWDGGGDYPWPAAAAATTVVSSAAADAAAGTGARTVKIIGLDANYLEVSETATLDGVTPVALSTAFLRVHRCQVLTAGSGGVNAGDIQIKHSSTVIAQISTGYGQTLMAVYTVPADFEQAGLISWYVSVGKTLSVVATTALLMRAPGGAWQTKELIEVSNNGDFQYHFDVWPDVAPKTDLRVRVVAISAQNTKVAAGFDIAQYNRN